MQNKGIVICVAVLLTLASIFYLSFSFATRYYDGEAAKIKDPIAQQDYKDSVKYLGVYSYQNCLETQIGLGLDLKGGMNVILEISVPDVIENLADHKTDAGFTKAMKEARAQEEANGGDFVSLFINAYHKSAPGHKLAEVFATQQLQGKVSPQSSDAEVERLSALLYRRLSTTLSTLSAPVSISSVLFSLTSRSWKASRAVSW